MLTAKGADIYENIGWRKHLADYENQMKIQQEKANRQPNNITINAPVIGSQIGQESDFRDLENITKVIPNAEIVDKITITKSKLTFKEIIQ